MTVFLAWFLMFQIGKPSLVAGVTDRGVWVPSVDIYHRESLDLEWSDSCRFTCAGGPGLLGKRLYEKLDVRSIGPISFGASY